MCICAFSRLICPKCDVRMENLGRERMIFRVTPDGQWHENDEGPKDTNWRETARSIFSKNLDTLAIGVDCHA